MSKPSPFYGLFWPGMLTLIGIVILISLGNWQMKRKAWKADLKSVVEARLASEPISFGELKRRAAARRDIRYQPVKVQGMFDHSQERHYFLPLNGKVGWHIITPFNTKSGDVVFVDRGFVPDKFKGQSSRMDGLAAGEVTLVGLARIGEGRGFFTPNNDVAQNKWYGRDLPELYDSLTPRVSNILPFMLDARDVAQVGQWPLAGVTKVTFKDPHLGYALTWYGLSLTLIGVFLVFAYYRVREQRDS